MRLTVRRKALFVTLEHVPQNTQTVVKDIKTRGIAFNLIKFLITRTCSDEEQCATSKR